MTTPLCIDLYCGRMGWGKGFLAAGYDYVGFDIVRFKKYQYPGQLVLQDVRTLCGRQFRNASCIVASPPCQEFSRKALPWHRDKPDPDLGIVLFNEARRIIEEAGVPGVIENVRNAQRWMGRADAHFGSFYLWGDVPLLRPKMHFEKGAFCSRIGPKSRDYAAWHARKSATVSHLTRSPHLRAEIPFDLAYWLATEWKRTAA